MYYSASNHKLKPLYQDAPEFWNENDPQPSFTNSIYSYIKRAGHIAACINSNDKYRWLATINIDVEQDAQTAIETWNKINRRLKTAGLSFLWVREINLNNRLHYHLIIKGQHILKDLTDLISKASEGSILHHIWVEKIRHSSNYVRYIFKTKVHDNERDLEDRYLNKRVLFINKSGLSKHGSTKSFWSKPMKHYSDEIKQAFYHRPNEGLDLYPDVRDLAYTLHRLCDPSMSVDNLAREYAYWLVEPQSPKEQRAHGSIKTMIELDQENQRL